MRRTCILFLFVTLIPVLGICQSSKVDKYIYQENYQEALNELNRIEGNRELKTQELQTKARIFRALFQFEKAVDIYQGLLTNGEGTDQIRQELGYSLAELGKNKEAIEQYSTVWQNDSTNVRVGVQLGNLYLAIKDYKSAYPVFTYLNKNDSTNVYLKLNLAKAAFGKGSRKEAIVQYREILKIDPEHMGSVNHLVKLFNKNAEYESSIELLKKYTEKYPDDKHLSKALANAYFGCKRYEEAYKCFDRFKAEGDSTIQNLTHLGICCYFTQKYEEGIDLFSRCYAQALNDPFLFFYFGLCLKETGQYEDAAGFLKSSIEIATPGFIADIYHHLAVVYGRQRKFTEAIAAYKKVLDMNPEKITVLYEIATTYEEFNQDKTVALTYYNSFLNKSKGKENKKVHYALDRIRKIKEDLFFEE
ncbi:DUF2989 domain-containing protein [Puteibacter caeruleilacunae]|nr:DUF2989 domain-containing protein [Puteibacter caeruleilacunae]